MSLPALESVYDDHHRSSLKASKSGRMIRDRSQIPLPHSSSYRLPPRHKRVRQSRKVYSLTPIHESQGGPCMDDRRGQGKQGTLSREYKGRYSCTSTYNKDLSIEECIDRTITALDCLEARIENADIILTKRGYWDRYGDGWKSHQPPMLLLSEIIRKNHKYCVKRVRDQNLGIHFNQILGEINRQQQNLSIPSSALTPRSETGGTGKRKRTQKLKRIFKKLTHSRKKRTKNRTLKKKHYVSR